MNVYAFDVDGTLETSNGPIGIRKLRMLQGQGHYVYIVSPSMARPKDFPVVLVGTRAENLAMVKSMHPDEDRFVYLSDNNDQPEAAAAGFEYVDARDFGKAA